MSTRWTLKNVETGESIPLLKPINRAGRCSGVEIICKSSTVSRNHGEFVILSDGTLRVQDFSSSNGTYINNRKIEVNTPFELKHSDEVGLGMCRSGDYRIAVQPPYYVFQVIKESPVVNNTQDLIEILDDTEIVKDVKYETEEPPDIPNVISNRNNSDNSRPCRSISTSSRETENNFEKRDACFVKQEHSLHIKEEDSNDANKNYSMDDECIVLSDDDEEFLCSQLFKIDDAAINPAISDNIFTNIKTELAEMDKLSGTPDAIEVDNEELSWENDIDAKQLESILSDGKSIEIVCKNGDATKQSGLNQTELDYLNELSRISYHFELDPDFEVQPDPKEDVAANEKQNKVSKDMEPSTSKGAGKTKYSKPPIVTAHVEKKRTREKAAKKPATSKSKKETSKEPKKISPGKRKQEMTHEVPLKKRKKSTDLRTALQKNGTISPKRSSERIMKKGQEKIKEIKTEKLKEIANRTESTKETVTKKTPTITAKVKISNGRGSFLLEEGPSCQRKSVDSKGKEDKSKLKLDRSSLHKTENNDKKFDTETKSKIENRKVEVKQVNLKNENKVAVCNPHTSRFETNYISRNNVPLPQVNYFDVILNVLKWPTKWLEEQRHQRNAPAVTNLRTVPMKLKFENYNDYYNTVMPLLTLELWYSIYKDYDRESQKNSLEKCITAAIDSAADNVQEASVNIRCMYYLPKDCDATLKEEDLLLIQVPIEESRSNKVSHCKVFGFVTRQQKLPLLSNDKINTSVTKVRNGKPSYKAIVNIKIKKLDGIIAVGKQCYIRHITSLTSALRIFKSAKYLQHSALCKFVLTPSINDFKLSNVPKRKFISKDRLNVKQEKAVLEAAHICTRSEPGMYLIQGPPGTGKSTVITNIVQEILFGSGYNSKMCILLVAPSNAAIDELTVRLVRRVKPQLPDDMKRNLKVVRVGPKQVIHPEVVPYALHSIVARNIVLTYTKDPQYAGFAYEMEKCKLDIQTKKKLNENSTQQEEKLQKLTMDMHDLIKKRIGPAYNKLYKRKELIILGGANIICTTLSSCMRIAIEDLYRSCPYMQTCCIIDEATQSTEQETLIPLILGIKNLVLVGDPQQLPATTLSVTAKKLGYGNSLFARIQHHLEREKENPVNMLVTQYRMHPEISSYPNSAFYKGKLLNSPNFRVKEGLKSLAPYLVLNMSSLNFLNNGYSNESEAHCVVKLICGIQSVVKNSCLFSIGVITPYNVQKESIKSKLTQQKFGRNVSIVVNTIDSFQGQEKDIIIISCVRYDSNSFLADDRRLNVAITRAKYGLYIVGSNNLFKTCVVLGNLSDNAESRKLLYNVNSSMDIKTCAQFLTRKNSSS